MRLSDEERARLLAIVLVSGEHKTSRAIGIGHWALLRALAGVTVHAENHAAILRYLGRESVR